MNFLRKKTIIVFLIPFIFSQFSFAQQPALNKKDEKRLNDGLRILRTYFIKDKNWYSEKSGLHSDICGLIHFIEDAPIDTVLLNLDQTQNDNVSYVFRLPENVADSLSVPGYISSEMILRNTREIKTELQQQTERNPVPVPEEIIARAQQQAPVIPEGKGLVLFSDSIYSFPDSLTIPEVIPESVLNSPGQFKKIVQIDSLRAKFIEEKRQTYNDSIINLCVTKAGNDYRRKVFAEQLDFRIKRYKETVQISNYQVLRSYNNRVMTRVNDSIRNAIAMLTRYADYIDTSEVSLMNLNGEKTNVILQNGRERYSRIWLKNEQNDSLLVLVKTRDKKNMQLLISDGVTFSRFSEKQTKDFDFGRLKTNKSTFSKVGNVYEVKTPWTLSGDASANLTQTSYKNWKSGGESSFATLFILKGAANYTSSNGKKTWKNSIEIRNGWLKPGGDEIEKNEDKIELTSKYAISALKNKKWSYSTELNVKTQLFRGYKYPTSTYPDPISSFMAPVKTIFKVGMTYNPNKSLSLAMSPLSVKNVFVKDTSLIDQTQYDIAENRKAFWKPGFNADLTYQKQITSDIKFESSYNMFINYTAPFSKWDIDWENNLTFQVNNYIKLSAMLHLLYDSSVKFSKYDSDGNEIGEETRLQVKEFISIGFSYSLNKKIMRARRL